MSQRYTKLFTHPQNTLCGDYSVKIVAGALLLDNQTGKKLAQIKFCSLAAGAVGTLKVRLHVLDAEGQELPEAVEYTYSGLNAQNGQEFGQDKPISVPDGAASFQVEVTELQIKARKPILNLVPIILVAAALVLNILLFLKKEYRYSYIELWEYIIAAILPGVLLYGYRNPGSLKHSAKIWLSAAGTCLAVVLIANILNVAARDLLLETNMIGRTLSVFVGTTPTSELLNMLLNFSAGILKYPFFWSRICLMASAVMNVVVLSKETKKKA